MWHLILKQLMFLKITIHPNILSKNLAIIDFFKLEIGIASLLQPKWTSLLAVFSIFSLLILFKKLTCELPFNENAHIYFF